MKKYEFIAFLTFSLILLLLSISTIQDIRKSVTDFNMAAGKIASVGLCDKPSTLVIKGFTYFINKHIFCTSLSGRSEKYIIYEINSQNDKIFNTLAENDSIIVFCKRSNSENFAELIEIKKSGVTIYSKSQWNKQQMRVFIAITAFCIVMMAIGIWGFRKFMKNKNIEKKTTIWSTYFSKTRR